MNLEQIIINAIDTKKMISFDYHRHNRIADVTSQGIDGVYVAHVDGF